MREEFERLLPVMRQGGFLPSVDHQTPPGVSLEKLPDLSEALRRVCPQGLRRLGAGGRRCCEKRTATDRTFRRCDFTFERTAKARASGFRATRDAGGRPEAAARFGCRTRMRIRPVLEGFASYILPLNRRGPDDAGGKGPAEENLGETTWRTLRAERLKYVSKGNMERIELDAIAEIEKTFARILGKRNGASRGRPPE